jgi:hypothetical protein
VEATLLSVVVWLIFVVVCVIQGACRVVDCKDS